MSEAEPKSIPPDQMAPSLVIWGDEDQTGVHYSELTPDPSASIDLKTWSRLYYQLTHIYDYGTTLVRAKTDQGNLLITLPFDFDYHNEPSSIYFIAQQDEHFTDESGAIYGKRRTSFELDILRPGYLAIREQYYGEPDHTAPDPAYGSLDTAISFDSGQHIDKDNNSIFRRESVHLMTPEQAKAFEQTLSSAIADYDIPATEGWPDLEEIRDLGYIEQIKIAQEFYPHLGAEMQLMRPGMASFSKRIYIDFKSLFDEPEQALLTEAKWGVGTGNYGHIILIDHPYKYEMISHRLDAAVTEASSSILVQLDNHPEEVSWILQQWDKSELPDGFIPRAHEPHNVQPITLQQIVDKNVPKEILDAVEYDVRVGLFSMADVLQADFDKFIKLAADDPTKVREEFSTVDVRQVLRYFETKEKRYKNLLLDATQALADRFEKHPPLQSIDLVEDLHDTVEGTIDVAVDPWGGRDKNMLYLELMKAFG